VRRVGDAMQGGGQWGSLRLRRDGGVAESAQDSGISGSAMSCSGRRKGWPAPEAPIRIGEVRCGGNLGGKPGGGGAHRDAEVVAMAAPNLVGWRGVRCPRPIMRACSAEKGGGARARTRGEWGGGWHLLNRRRDRERVWRRGERRRRGVGVGVGTPRGGGRGGPGATAGSSGRPVTAPRPSGAGGAMTREQGDWGADRWATATVPGGCAG
jgi:hypothetical protein